MEARKRVPERQLTRRGDGWCIECPGDYLWDEDPEAVLKAAAALDRGVAARPAQRMRVVSEHGTFVK